MLTIVSVDIARQEHVQDLPDIGCDLENIEHF